MELKWIESPFFAFIEHISTQLKNIAIRLLAGLFRFIHRNRFRLLGYAKTATRPLTSVVRWMFRTVFVHLYRLTFGIRRLFRRLGLPAKGKVMAIVANRYVAHAAVVGIVFFVSATNISAREVRADTPGEKSMLFSLLSGGEDDGLVEEVVDDSSMSNAVNGPYWGSGTLSAPLAGDVDDINFEDEAALNPELAGGVAVLQPTLPEGAPSIAPRTKTELYVVRAGDSLNLIAERFGVSVSTILWENKLTVRDYIRPGDRLTLLPITGVSHTVKKGDTISKIAKTYGSEAEKILAWNSPGVTGELRVGDKLIVPDGSPPAPPAPRRLAPVGKIVSPGARGSVRGSGSMVWPTSWRVITQYFKWRHSGLDIDGDYNTPLFAADTGIVTHSGWGRTHGGYGFYIDIDHGNGLQTRYGHASKIFVTVGDRVERGQNIGMVGTTGRSTGTHLHFEVIRNGRKVNPLEYIR